MVVGSSCLYSPALGKLRRQDPEFRDRFGYSEIETSLDYTRLRLRTTERKKEANTTTCENPGSKSLEVLRDQQWWAEPRESSVSRLCPIAQSPVRGP